MQSRKRPSTIRWTIQSIGASTNVSTAGGRGRQAQRTCDRQAQETRWRWMKRTCHWDGWFWRVLSQPPVLPPGCQSVRPVPGQNALFFSFFFFLLFFTFLFSLAHEDLPQCHLQRWAAPVSHMVKVQADEEMAYGTFENKARSPRRLTTLHVVHCLGRHAFVQARRPRLAWLVPLASVAVCGIMVALVTLRRGETQQILLGEVASFERHESWHGPVGALRSMAGCSRALSTPNWCRFRAGNPNGASESGRRRVAGRESALERDLCAGRFSTQGPQVAHQTGGA